MIKDSYTITYEVINDPEAITDDGSRCGLILIPNQNLPEMTVDRSFALFKSTYCLSQAKDQTSDWNTQTAAWNSNSYWNSYMELVG